MSSGGAAVTNTLANLGFTKSRQSGVIEVNLVSRCRDKGVLTLAEKISYWRSSQHYPGKQSRNLWASNLNMRGLFHYDMWEPSYCISVNTWVLLETLAKLKGKIARFELR